MSAVEAIPAETGLEAGGYAKGVAVAVVTQNQDPDGMCRVKCAIPGTTGARKLLGTSGDADGRQGSGMVLIPEVGDEVVVASSARICAFHRARLRAQRQRHDA